MSQSFTEKPLWLREKIADARDERRIELEPIRIEIDALITEIGWRKAKPVVEMVMGVEIPRQRGSWWRLVGKRKAKALLIALKSIPASTPVHEAQGRLF